MIYFSLVLGLFLFLGGVYELKDRCSPFLDPAILAALSTDSNKERDEPAAAAATSSSSIRQGGVFALGKFE